MRLNDEAARREGGDAGGLLRAKKQRAGRPWPAAALASTALAGALVAGQACAQEAPAASLDEVVVTAQKRAERLQDVPVAVSALSGDQLARQRVTTLDDIASFAPSLHLQSPGGDDLPVFALRGISMADYSSNQSGPVATYFDEVYKGPGVLKGISLYDLERIEVLRGPQGTLYGKNTTGGAINIISRKPVFENGGELTVGYGAYDHWQAHGALNAVLSDGLATRLAFTAENADGWTTNALPGRPKAAETDAYGARLSILARPTDDAEFILRVSGSYQHPRNPGVKGQPLDDLGIGGEIYGLFGMPGYVPTGLGKYDVQNNKSGKRLYQTSSVSLTGNIDLPNDLTLTSITSWDWGRTSYPDDADGSPLEALEVDYFAHARQIAQDLRLTSDFDGPFNFILGGYYNREKIYNSTVLSFFTDIDFDGSGAIDAEDCLANFFIACKYANSFIQTKTSLAAYTDLKYELTDRLTLRGGLRYTHDKGRLNGYESHVEDVNRTFLFPVIAPADLARLGADRFRKDNLSGKIGLDFKAAEGQLYYVSVSRGYRGNAFNAQAFFDPSEASVVKPETLTDIEAGAKLTLLDRRLILNLSAFRYDYKNMQFLDLVDGRQLLVNVPKARIYGGEVELMARPTQALSLRMGLGLLDSEIRDGELNGVDLRGNELANSPHVSLTLGMDWDLAELSAGTLSLHADAVVTSKQYFDVFNEDAQSRSSYALLNGSLNFESADRRWGASIWAKNLLGEFYYAYRIGVDTVASNYQHPGEPRTYGVTLTRSF